MRTASPSANRLLFLSLLEPIGLQACGVAILMVMNTQYPQVMAADAAGIAQAGALLAAGEIVALPTETVYGLAADATSSAAVAKVYAAKGRPAFNPLIVHVADRDAARHLVDIPSEAEPLIAQHWPGPLTLVLPARTDCGIASLVRAGLPTLAVRVPAHPVMQAVLRALGKPLAAPSANASGHISPTRAQHVVASLEGRVPLILDAGACAVGLESTIIGFEAGRAVLLRTGGLALEALADTLGYVPLEAVGSGITAPGQLASHYAPRQPLRLNVRDRRPGEFLIGFGNIPGDVSLSPSGDLTQAAAQLFDALHQAEASDATTIAVAPMPPTGLGVAINDRLRRAAKR